VLESIRAFGQSALAIRPPSILGVLLAHYSSEDVRKRIVFPVDFDAIHGFEPDDSGEQNLWAGRSGVFAIDIVPYAPPQAPELTVIARPTGWLARSLTRDGFRLSQSVPASPWHNLGGVFTPMSHEDTLMLHAQR
jgi:hypothetical protein